MRIVFIRMLVCRRLRRLFVVWFGLIWVCLIFLMMLVILLVLLRCVRGRRRVVLKRLGGVRVLPLMMSRVSGLWCRLSWVMVIIRLIRRFVRVVGECTAIEVSASVLSVSVAAPAASGAVKSCDFVVV